MLTLLTTLMLIAPQDGHVFGGQSVDLVVQRAIDSAEPLMIEWVLSHDGVVLTYGELPLQGPSAVLTVQLPEVRVRITVEWTCRVFDADNRDHALATGMRTLTLYPPVSFPSQGFGAAVLITPDEESSLATLLAEHISDLDVRDEQNIDLMGIVRLVMIDQEALTERVSALARRVAERGGDVLVLAQAHSAAEPAGPRLVTRLATPPRWRLEHPLLAALDVELLNAWATDRDIIQAWRTAGEQAFVVGGWPPAEAHESNDAPRDALLCVEQVGRGRIVRCQLRVDDWRADPRGQTLLRNALVYLTSTTPAAAAGHSEAGP